MSAGHALARARVRALVVSLSVVASGVFVASAVAATVQVAATTLTPEQAIPVGLGILGTADAGAASSVQVVVRPAGGLDCQPDFESDLSAAGNADTVILGSGGQSVAPGPYTVSATFKPPAAGSYQVCAWLTESVSGTPQTVAGPASTSFTARPPQVSQLTLAVPPAPQPNVAFELVYTTQTDQQLNLYSVIKKAGALPCASSYELEVQQEQPEKTLFGLGFQQVFGGPTPTTLTDQEPAGAYVICSWIEGPTTEEADASLSTPLTIAALAPVKTTSPAKLELRLRKVTASRRHGISVTGTTAKAFTGRLLVAAACGTSRQQTEPPAKQGRFSAALRLPAGCRGRQRVRLSVSWGGSSTFAKASAGESVRVRS
jgi:hypothetical protein